jgi:phosphatidylglycerol---prolipoprotein diacylglyceryl transferase
MILAEAWFHTLSPFALRFTDSFGIRWYGLSYILAFLIGWGLLKWLSKRGAVRIPPERVGDAVLYGVLGVIVGGRLGYVFFYQPSLLWTIMDAPPWWGVLAINMGGMASHGGMIGIAIASWVIARGWKNERGERTGRVPMLHIGDAIALVAPFGLFLGRIANFINGELLGRIVAQPGEPSPWWAVKFPQEITLAARQQPQLTTQQQLQLEALVEQVRLPGMSWDAAFDRLLYKVQHAGGDWAARLEPLISARHPSQIYQAFAEGIVLGAVLWFIARRPRIPGVVGAWFLITYGLLRVITEFWRLPDAHLVQERIVGLSRGQWLSVAMVLIGLALLVVLLQRGGERMGGWLRSAPGAEAPPSPIRP